MKKIGKVKANSYSSTYEIPMRNHIVPYFKGKSLTDIRPADIQQFLDSKSSGMSAENLKKLRFCLRKLFETAIENRICTFNPVTKNIRIKSDVRKTEKRFYTFEQRDQVVEYAKTHKFGLPIIIMLYTGLSRSELLGLNWEDVTDDYVIHVRRGVTDLKDDITGKYRVDIADGLKNEFRQRDIPIPKWLYDMIQQKPRIITLGGSVRNKTPVREIETEFIFSSAVGKAQSPHNFSYYVYKPFMADMQAHFKSKNIDMPALNPHELRHTAATLWALGGLDLYTIAKLGGWSDLKMLAKVYGHTDVDVMRKALGY